MQPFADLRVSLPMPTSPCPRSVVLFSLAALLAIAAGCSSPSEPEHSAPPPAAAIDLPPVMAGTEIFADGKITVKVTLAMPGNFRGGKDGDRPGGGAGKTGGSGHHGGGGGRHRDPGGADLPPTGNTEDEGPHLTGSNLPPAQLKLYLQNNSAIEAVQCEVTDFKSYLGDFAVYPASYHIEAGQSADSEAMTSRLGVEGAEIPLTVALRIGNHTESKVVTLRAIPPPADAAK